MELESSVSYEYDKNESEQDFWAEHGCGCDMIAKPTDYLVRDDCSILSKSDFVRKSVHQIITNCGHTLCSHA